MLRSDGVDVANYRYSFEESYNYGITDPGFRYLIDVFNLFNLTIESLFFFVGCVAIVSIKRISTFFKVDLTLLFFYSFCIYLF